MEDLELLMERHGIVSQRIREIAQKAEVPEPFDAFFRTEAAFLCDALDAWPISEKTLEELEAMDEVLYGDLAGDRYAASFGNPAYSVKIFGDYGKPLCFLYAELKGLCCHAAEYAYYKEGENGIASLWEITILQELFLEIYSMFTDEELPTAGQVTGRLVSYVQDYLKETTRLHVCAQLDPEADFALKIIMESSLDDLRYLYRFGEHISTDERTLAAYLNTLPEQQIREMAAVYTKGYRDGFQVTHKDFSKKRTVGIYYHLGFERVVREAVLQFREMGLTPVIFRHPLHAVNGGTSARPGFTGAVPNPQYDFDHRQDMALFLSEDYVTKRLRFLQEAYQEFRSQAAVYGGPAVIETFGEDPFNPEMKPEAYSLSDGQQSLLMRLRSEAAQITARFIKPEERSFTIISWPMPAIGENFPEVFQEVWKCNTLDSDHYKEIQQKIIDVLDTCEWVLVKGKGDNETDLIIHLHELKHPKRQTNFENCGADVNIPVGEVFTSPVLAGTGGILHVSGVYLNGLYFKDLRLIFDCGQVIDYSCANFASPEENRRYIEDNIFHHHVKIPMGEFAIGTNTTAYSMARRLGIESRLPILIAEKLGPHFAVGDTCYAREEDVKMYNPDGKECIARENELSALRNEDPELAYYNCHTDITLPYEELDRISVVDEEGEETLILSGGRFVVEGTEELNAPL